MAKGNNQWVKISGYLFLLGVLIAVVAGFITIPETNLLLVVLGAIIGLLAAFGMGSISKDDTELFMLATIALVAAGGSGAAFATIEFANVGLILQTIIQNIVLLVAPAVVIVALEAIWKVGSEKVI